MNSALGGGGVGKLNIFAIALIVFGVGYIFILYWNSPLRIRFSVACALRVAQEEQMELDTR
jgi:hypothetical protein